MRDFNIKQSAVKAHRKAKGKLSIISKVPLKTIRDMSLFYTPGVAEASKIIARNPSEVYNLTSKWNTIAVVTDGTAVLGLGDIGPAAALPVMEGKCALFKEFAGVDAIPICIDSKDPDVIVETVRLISPSLGGINLEDISAPRCFEIEKRLKAILKIPVFHDDQHGTAIVCLAGLINALKVVEKRSSNVRVVINGAGAAGLSIAGFLLEYGFKDLVLVDSKGIIFEGREDLKKGNEEKKKFARITNSKKVKGNLSDAIIGADIFIGVSRPGVLSGAMVKKMAKDSIVFAMANPDPEIDPSVALKSGAKVVATGRSDYPNQINNVLAFPGIFRGALDNRVRDITVGMQLNAAKAIAALIRNPSAKKIIPGVFDKRVVKAVAGVIR